MQVRPTYVTAPPALVLPQRHTAGFWGAEGGAGRRFKSLKEIASPNYFWEGVRSESGPVCVAAGAGAVGRVAPWHSVRKSISFRLSLSNGFLSFQLSEEY